MIGGRKRSAAAAGVNAPAWEIRALRFLIGAALIIAAVLTLRSLLSSALPEANKLEVGLLLGWLIAKSGTVIDWLFGGSESGTRRADQQAATASQAAPPDAAAAAEDVAGAATERAEEISGERR